MAFMSLYHARLRAFSRAMRLASLGGVGSTLALEEEDEDDDKEGAAFLAAASFICALVVCDTSCTAVMRLVAPRGIVASRGVGDSCTAEEVVVVVAVAEREERDAREDVELDPSIRFSF